MSAPGHWLRTAAARLCSSRTLERVVDPIVTDIQTEHADAVRAGRRWRAARIRARGYAAFWKAIGLHAIESSPRALWKALIEDDAVLARTIAYSLLVFILVALAVTASPMAHFHSRGHGVMLMLLLVPQAIPVSIPIAVSLGIVCGYGGAIRGARIRGAVALAVAGTLVAFAATLRLPDANQAFRVAMAQELGARGVTMFSLPRGANELSLSELSARSKEYDAAGSSNHARELRRTFHLRFALPAATLVLGFLALGIAATVRHRALQLAAIVIGVGVYWVMLATAMSRGSLPPAVSAWAPNLVLIALAGGLSRRRLSAARE